MEKKIIFKNKLSFFLEACGENQVWSECASACQAQCNNFDVKKSERCAPFQILLCKQDCVCKEGYLRNDDGQCIESVSAACGGKYEPKPEWKFNIFESQWINK